jgi:glucosamine-6-phosphate deaminase
MMTTALTPIPHVQCSPEEAASTVAREISDFIRARRAAGRGVVLGLATGRTPLGIYAELARLHREERLDFSNVTAFNLDEYLGLRPGHPRSYRRYMREHLFDAIGLPFEQTHIPSSDVAPGQWEAHCREYERLIADAGGIDLQLLGLGRNGHIGFNEPGSERDTRTRVVELARTTREDAAGDFGGVDNVPERAISMGIATILSARRIRLLAFGVGKREIVERTLTSPPSPQLPATFLRGHSDVRLYADAAALGAAGGAR